MLTCAVLISKMAGMSGGFEAYCFTQTGGSLALFLQLAPRFSVADSQQVLPRPKVALEAYAFSYLKRRDEHNCSSCLPGRFLNHC